MKLKDGVLLMLLVTLFYTVIASQNTCGPTFEGDFLGDFHNGHSYASYNISETYMKVHYLTYQNRFCTKIGSGIIAQLTSKKTKEDIVVEVSDGYPVVHLRKNRSADPECSFTLNKRVTDDYSYLIKVEIKGKQMNMTLYRQNANIYSLSVDISTCLEGNFSAFTFLEMGGEKVDESFSERVKAVHRGKPHLINDFDGCIGDTLLNGIPVGKAGTVLEKHDIDPKCIHNFGPECTDICPTSYIPVDGKECRCPKESVINEYDLCAPSCECIQCQNGGSCSLTSGSDTVCKCAPYYEGKYCENEVDRCREFVCRNGGTCTVQSSGPSCTCPPTYTGILCEVHIVPEDPCRNDQCQNNATCVRNATLESKYFCDCLPGYSGTLCEYQEKTDTKLTREEFAGITLGCIAFVVIGVLAVYFVVRSRGKKMDKQNEAAPPPGNSRQPTGVPAAAPLPGRGS